MALASQMQDDFGGGMYRGRNAPGNAVYDAVNALVNDDGLLFKRGGSAYKTTSNAAESLLGMAVVNLPVGPRVPIWGASKFMTLDSAETATVTLLSSNQPHAFARGVSVGGMVAFPNDAAAYSTGVVFYGGSRKTASVPIDSMPSTADVTNGQRTVTGHSSSWSGSVDAGMILRLSGYPDYHGVVSSVDSNTQVTLVAPWQGATATGQQGSFYQADISVTTMPIPSASRYLATVAGRLLIAAGNRVFFSERDLPYSFNVANYHELPDDAAIIGAIGFQDVAIIATTTGLWAISDMALDAVDDFGNQQHEVQRISNDLILLGDPGIAAWGGQLILPGVDDVYLFSPGAPPVPITGARGSQFDGGIRAYYRTFAEAGYAPGTAGVYRGHYILPILNGSSLVDVLVCRLDRGLAWTRWSGHAATGVYGVRSGSSTRTPKLFAANGLRVADVTGCFSPTASNSSDADATIADATIITRDYPTGQQHGFVQRARLRYELTDGGTPDPTVAIAHSSDADAGVFTTLTERGEHGGAAGWGVSDGSKYNWALVAKRRERIRFRITVAGAAASFVLRSIELLLRPSGRQ